VALSTTGRTLEVGRRPPTQSALLSPGIDPRLLKVACRTRVGERLELGRAVSRPSVYRCRLNRAIPVLLTPLTAPLRRRSNQGVRASVGGWRGHQLSEDLGHYIARPRNRP
jgi:hypothetical protein